MSREPGCDCDGCFHYDGPCFRCETEECEGWWGCPVPPRCVQVLCDCCGPCRCEGECLAPNNCSPLPCDRLARREVLEAPGGQPWPACAEHAREMEEAGCRLRPVGEIGKAWS